MKTLADLKRRVQPGVQLLAVDHWQDKLKGSIRTVTRTQGNGYWFCVPGDQREMWSGYDKAAFFSFPAPNQYRYERDGKGWTLEILGGVA